jgi:hypothetical protein
MTEPDPAAALAARLNAPVQPRLEAAMAATVTLAAYPPAAAALWQHSLRTGQPATPDRWLIPPWTTAVTGTPEQRRDLHAAAADILGGVGGAYPPGTVDEQRFGAAWHGQDPGCLRAAWTVVTWHMLAAQERYLGTLAGGGRDAYVRHCAGTAGEAFGAAGAARSYGRLQDDYGHLIDTRLQRTPAGQAVLADILGSTVAGWPGELLAARCRWLIPADVTDVLGVDLPAPVMTPDEFRDEYARRCPYC